MFSAGLQGRAGQIGPLPPAQRDHQTGQQQGQQETLAQGGVGHRDQAGAGQRAAQPDRNRPPNGRVASPWGCHARTARTTRAAPTLSSSARPGNGRRPARCPVHPPRGCTGSRSAASARTAAIPRPPRRGPGLPECPRTVRTGPGRPRNADATRAGTLSRRRRGPAGSGPAACPGTRWGCHTRPGPPG